MKKTRWIILLFVFIFVGIQTGCARSNPFIEKEESEASSDSEAPSEETTPEESESSSQEEPSSEESQEASSEESQEASEEESTEPAEETPIRQLFCLKDAGYIRKIRSYADGSLVVCTGVLSDDPEIGEGYKDSSLYEIDPARDEILQKATMEGKDIELLAVRNNGELFITDALDGSLTRYDRNFRPVEGGSIDTKFSYYTYVPEQDCFYYFDGIQLMRRPVEGEATTWIENGLGLDISFTEPKDGMLIINQGSDKQGYSSMFHLYDTENNQFLWNRDDNNSRYYFTKDAVLSLREMWEEEGVKDRLDVLDPQTGEKTATWELKPYEMIFTSPDSSTIFSICYIADQGYTARIIDPMSGAWADLGLSGIDEYMDICWDEASGRWYMGAKTEDGTVLLSINPAGLSFTEQLKEDTTQSEPETFTLGEHLSEVRAAADAIEEKYGVRILLGNEIYNYNLNAAYGLISSEDPENGGGTEEEATVLSGCLQVLDQALSIYPEGFFETFVSGTGQGGLRFLFVRDLVNEDGSFTPGGVQQKSGSWYDVILDLDLSGTSTIHHELWHAVESRITNENYTVFSDEEWSRFNPDGFIYNYNFDAYAEGDLDQSLFQYLLINGEDAYFIDTYSMITAMEDRATLIEALFSLAYSPDGSEQANYDYIMSFPHIKAKLDYMAEQTEKVFGSVYWADYVNTLS